MRASSRSPHWSARGVTSAAASCRPGARFSVARDTISRPDLIKPGTRVVNVLELGRALTGGSRYPPISALFVYNCNPIIACPEEALVAEDWRARTCSPW